MLKVFPKVLIPKFSPIITLFQCSHYACVMVHKILYNNLRRFKSVNAIKVFPQFSL